jgi:hypothetical protein
LIDFHGLEDFDVIVDLSLHRRLSGAVEFGLGRLSLEGLLQSRKDAGKAVDFEEQAVKARPLIGWWPAVRRRWALDRSSLLKA